MSLQRLILIPLLVLFNGVAVAADEAVLGTWLTADGKSKVEIAHCGSELCGKIVWLKEPTYPADDEMAGQSKMDRNNPENELQTRPLMGLSLLSGFHYDADNVWEGGKIYDPRNGKTYSCKLTLEDENTLKVRGYIGFSFIGRTAIWTR